jgi:hypothetical protein
MVAELIDSNAFPTYEVETDTGIRQFRKTAKTVGRQSGRFYYDRIHKDGPKIVLIEAGESKGDAWEVEDLEGDFIWQRAPVWIYERIERNEWIPLKEI